MRILFGLTLCALIGCEQTDENTAQVFADTELEDLDISGEESLSQVPEIKDLEKICDGQYISSEAVDRMIELTEVTDNEDAYSTYARIDGIASLFEACGDPWGLFPTTYRRITARGLAAIEAGEFDDPAWANRIIVDFAGRYMENLRLALQDREPSWAWKHYYRLALREDVSRTRSVVVAMCAHLMLDLPYSLAAIETTEENKNDFFVFGDMMIEVADLFIDDLKFYYETDAEALLNGFFFGDWVDGVFGENAMMTLSYQAIRTKSWNNRWYLEQDWGMWVADSEIWSSFWLTEGVLATLDATGAI